MDRRSHLKYMLTGAIGSAALLQACAPEKDKAASLTLAGYGRTPEEMERDASLRTQSFFTEEEKQLLTVLVDIILPADADGPAASELGVVDFIAFMAVDQPSLQPNLRGGLSWLNVEAFILKSANFAQLSPEERISIIDRIAFPDTALEADKSAVRFFNTLRNLTMTGYFTTEHGLKELGYVGNRPNVWDGVPQSVLDRYGLAYDEDTLARCVKPEERNTVIQWDEEGNIIG